jgi:GR25 family glycosyltransferase involved in LPS biosynthesis
MFNKTSRFGWYVVFLGNICLTNVLWMIQSLPNTFESSREEPYIAMERMIPTPKVQTYVVSLHQKNVEDFGRRNAQSGLNGMPWFPATNGYDQRVLDEWSAITGFRLLNATRFAPNDPKSKFGYENPHHVGCFMSHWNLLRLALEGWKAVRNRPDALFVFEDDSTCVRNTMGRALDIIKQLPEDWDLFYIGGKPFTYHEEDPLPLDWKNLTNTNMRKIPRSTFRELACQGVFGKSSTGPFAPDGSRNLSLKQPYWITRYITNTHAYVVNPQRIERVLRILEKPREYQVPLDIAWADTNRDGSLKAYIPTTEFCVQGDWPTENRKKESLWKGWYYHSQLDSSQWEDLYFPECPSKP